MSRARVVVRVNELSVSRRGSIRDGDTAKAARNPISLLRRRRDTTGKNCALASRNAVFVPGLVSMLILRPIGDVRGKGGDEMCRRGGDSLPLAPGFPAIQRDTFPADFGHAGAGVGQLYVGSGR